MNKKLMADALKGLQENCEARAKRSQVERGVSQPFRAGKDFKQFVHFRMMIIEGKKPVIAGPDYVVMSRQHYDELHSK